MSCDVDEVTGRLENKLCYDYNYELCSFSKLSVTSPTPQIILQTFRRFTYVTAHSPILPLLQLRHSSFSNLSFDSPTSQALHLTSPGEPPMDYIRAEIKSINAEELAEVITISKEDVNNLHTMGHIFCTNSELDNMYEFSF